MGVKRTGENTYLVPGAFSDLKVDVSGEQKGVFVSKDIFAQFREEFVAWMDTYTPPLNYAFFLHKNPKQKIPQIVLAVSKDRWTSVHNEFVAEASNIDGKLQAKEIDFVLEDGTSAKTFETPNKAGEDIEFMLFKFDSGASRKQWLPFFKKFMGKADRIESLK